MRFFIGLSYQRPLATLVAIVVLGCGLISSQLSAQESIDPGNIWFRAYLLVQASEESEKNGKFIDALSKLNEAQPLYLQLAQSFPDYEPDLIKQRRILIEDKRDELKEKMKNKSAPRRPIAQPMPQVGGGGARERETEIEQPDGEFALPAWPEGEGSSQALPQIDQGRFKRPSVGEISGGLYNDLKRKDDLIDHLMKENLEIKRKLDQSEAEQKIQRDKIAYLNSKAAEIKREQNSAGSGDVKRLQKALSDTLELLETSTSINEDLLAERATMNSEIRKLRSNVKRLEKERDNLLDIVSGEDKGGKALKELMDRNAKLTKQLDRAEKLAASLSELTTQKDSDINLLKSEIAKVKRDRDNLFADNARHQKNIDSLLGRLKMITDGLSPAEQQALKGVSPMAHHENELLRSMVLKRLRRESQIKEAKDLLLQQLDKVGIRSESLLGIIEDITSGEQWTAEEKALFRSPQFAELIDSVSDEVKPDNKPPVNNEDGSVSTTLIAPGKAPGKNDLIRDQKLAVELQQLDKSARLDFIQKRYAEAEAGFLRYNHFQPQSVSCLCNLGLVKMAMKNFSEAENFLQRAIALEKTSGLAYYLLGRTYFLQKRFDEALIQLEQGIKFSPRNAKAHNCLGIVSKEKGFVGRAEKAFVRAVSLEPNFRDAHFNLAVLYFTKDLPDAKKTGLHYFKSVELGGERSATIEDFLKQAEASSILGLR